MRCEGRREIFQMQYSVGFDRVRVLRNKERADRNMKRILIVLI